MAREKKAKIIDSLQESFDKCTIAIFTDYRGLTTAELTDLRHKLQEANSTYKVVKNTLAGFATERLGIQELRGRLKGPTAVVFGYGDISAPAKVLASYVRGATTVLNIREGFSEGRLLNAEQVISLATIPPKEVLLARVCGQINSPVSNLVAYLANPMRGFIGVLQARIKQLEGA
ncbi:MAG: 50S ribosomal protein L10 [Chloroflexi bacterium]|nr:50S ribosomal protein L10 [Chloroflexota bacterium]